MIWRWKEIQSLEENSIIIMCKKDAFEACCKLRRALGQYSDFALLLGKYSWLKLAGFSFTYMTAQLHQFNWPWQSASASGMSLRDTAILSCISIAKSGVPIDKAILNPLFWYTPSTSAKNIYWKSDIFFMKLLFSWSVFDYNKII